jgi:type III secretion protein V
VSQRSTTPLARLGERTLGGLSRYGDLVFALGVFVILLLLFIRVSPMAMDYLLALNLTASLTVLMVALFVPSAVKLPSFPTVLLLSTLFRLALNISSTRLILLEANAGKIIFAFGDFVVGGNYVVGAVVFALLSVIQLIVIAKGAERAAEVTARFMSDAVPGKQMAIDADLQRNAIDNAEAERRRGEVERESRLHGALTGAMYFVKGDAIAGIVISLVNIVGGLVIGVTQQGMPIGEAAQVYSLLTIGDGLVTQIAALMTSLSAGLIVTRVTGEVDKTAGANSNDVLTQMLAQPRALMIVSALLALIGVSEPWTGFPFLPFATLATVIGFLAWAQSKRQATTSLVAATATADAAVPATADGAEAPPNNGEPPTPAAALADAAADLDGPLPIHIQLHSSLYPFFDGGQDPARAAALRTALRAMREDVLRRYGVRLPPVNYYVDDDGLAEGQYSILIHGDPVANARLSVRHHALILGPRDRLSALADQGVRAIAGNVPGTRFDGGWVAADAVRAAEAAGLRALAHEALILRHLRLVVTRNLAEFIDIQTLATRIDKLEEDSPDLVQCVIRKGPVTIPQLAEIVRRLLRERVPVRDLRPVLESVARWAPKVPSMHHLIEMVRGDLRRVICGAFAAGRGVLEFYVLDPEVAGLFRSNRQETSDGPTCGFSYANRKLLDQAFARSVNAADAYLNESVAVVVADEDLRPVVRDFVATAFPHIVVVSKQRELTPGVFAERTLGEVRLAPESELSLSRA